MLRVMDPLHATIEEFATDGFTHVECCPRCRVTRLRADELATSHLYGADHRAAIGAVQL